MNKKTIIQLVFALIFFSITAYVFKNYESINISSFSKKNSPIQVDNSDDVKIEKLLGRSFVLEQSDIFNNEGFKNLKEPSVFASKIDKSSAGKRNPFEKK